MQDKSNHHNISKSKHITMTFDKARELDDIISLMGLSNQNLTEISNPFNAPTPPKSEAPQK